MGEIPLHMWVAAIGFVLGAVFGFTVRRTDFCMMGAVADLTLNGDARRMRAWLLAIAVAIAGVQGLQIWGVLNLASAFQLSPRLPWVSIPVGALLFGFGMVLACGCPSRGTVNAACGDLRALVSLIVTGLVAGMTLRGITAPARVWLDERTAIELDEKGVTPSQGIVEWLAHSTGVEDGVLRALVGGSGAALIAWFCFASTHFRAERRLWIAGVTLGLVVTGGWIATGVVGADEFEPTPIASLTFVRPVSDGLLYLMTFTGSTLQFGVAVLAGVAAGAFIAAATRGALELRGFEDLHELSRYLAGGALMGVGGVLALGCTVGQGITGVSSLSAGSVLALAFIIAGGVLGARYLEQGSLGRALRAALRLD